MAHPRRILLLAAATLLLTACDSGPSEPAQATAQPGVEADAAASAEADAGATTSVDAAAPMAAADAAAPHPKAPPEAAAKVELDPANDPVIASDAPHYDYGVVRPGDVVKHTFTVKNVGSRPLHIKRTEAG